MHGVTIFTASCSVVYSCEVHEWKIQQGSNKEEQGSG